VLGETLRTVKALRGKPGQIAGIIYLGIALPVYVVGSCVLNTSNPHP